MAITGIPQLGINPMSIALGWSESQENVCLSLVLNCQRILIFEFGIDSGNQIGTSYASDAFKGFSEQELVGIVSRDAMIGTGLIGPAK